jgi:hypothetical protein
MKCVVVVHTHTHALMEWTCAGWSEAADDDEMDGCAIGTAALWDAPGHDDDDDDDDMHVSNLSVRMISITMRS